MSLFHKQANRPDDTGRARADEVAWAVFSRCIAVQLQWSAFMGRQMLRLPKHARTASYVAFILLASGSSAYLVVSSVTNTHEKVLTIAHDRIQPKEARAYRPQPAIITPQDLQRVEHFIHYMDSLARSPGGAATYNSIIQSRPGLLDSARTIIQLYQPQKK